MAPKSIGFTHINFPSLDYLYFKCSVFFNIQGLLKGIYCNVAKESKENCGMYTS